MKKLLVVLFLLLSSKCFSQVLNGVVQDESKTPIFAAAVVLKSNTQKGVSSNFKGEFSVILEQEQDTLIILHVGYVKKEIPITKLDVEQNIIITLNLASISISDVKILGEDPISKRSSVSISNAMDIYMNPMSQGDPLKSLTILPSSTTIDESANPSFRGSSSDRSLVTLNGVPVYNPVRSSQLNNQGFFSLFSPEIIDKEYAHASNPPLTYGNTSAGLVEIETIKTLRNNQLQLSSSLAGAGALLSQKIYQNKTFIQAYFNHQFSNAMVGIQKASYPDIIDFSTSDGGFNFHSKLGERFELKSYTYFMDEKFDGYSSDLSYYGKVKSRNKRSLTINSIKYILKSGIIVLNTGLDFASPKVEFGNLLSNVKKRQLYSSLSYKLFLLNKVELETGASFEYSKYKTVGNIPTYYYAMEPTSPSYYLNEANSNKSLEAYIYGNWDISNSISLTAGARSNIPINKQKYYLSAQLGLKYTLNKDHYILLGGGNYHSYSVPNHYNHEYNLLSSQQASIDYSFQFRSSLLKAAAYYKNEKGHQAYDSFLKENVNLARIFGVEISFQQNFLKHFRASFSNAFVNQKMKIDGEEYKGPRNIAYFFKCILEYNNPKLFNASISYIGRPGSRYHTIVGSEYDNNANAYKPIYDGWYGSEFSNYNRFDVSVNKYIPMGKYALTLFVSVNNIFNIKNQEVPRYSKDYSIKTFSFLQRRNIYFGAVFYFNY